MTFDFAIAALILVYQQYFLDLFTSFLGDLAQFLGRFIP